VRGWIVVFAKEATAGHVKTRLSPPFSPAEAAAFYACLLADVLDETREAAASLGLETVLAVDPPGAVASMAALAPPGFRAIAQAPHDLGTRMTVVAHQAAAAGADFALLRGSDSPCLDRDVLGSAAAALACSDLVFSPDQDGGYGLVGIGPAALGPAARGQLFDHAMSTPHVLRDTLARAAKAGLRETLLPTGFDLDRYEDLRRLGAERQRPLRCRRTLAFLDQHDLWPGPSPHSQPIAGPR
jgi:rSAM/selenodomain-associated transferase 1